MQQLFSKSAMMVLVIFSNLTLYAQSNDTVVENLNEVLKKSLYKTEIRVDKDGTLTRKDNNGNTFTFNLKGVREITSGNDGFQNLFIKLKEGNISKGVVGGKQIDSELNVIAFKNGDDCKKAIELFRKLIKLYQ